MERNGRRVVVTGTGVLSPLGNDTAQSWARLIAGCSGAGPITRFDTANYDTKFACEVKDFTTEGVIDRKDAKRMDRFVQYAVVACAEAIKSAGLDLDRVDRDRVGVVLGSGIGGFHVAINVEGKYKNFNLAPQSRDKAEGRLILELLEASTRRGDRGK